MTKEQKSILMRLTISLTKDLNDSNLATGVLYGFLIDCTRAWFERNNVQEPTDEKH